MTSRWWCSLCDRTYTRTGDNDRCPYCKGRGHGAHWVQIKSKAFRRARRLSGLPLDRFRPTRGRDGGASADYWAPERRGSGYVGVWFPITDADCNEAIATATCIEVIGGRLVGFFGRGWEHVHRDVRNDIKIIKDRESKYQCLYDALRG